MPTSPVAAALAAALALAPPAGQVPADMSREPGDDEPPTAVPVPEDRPAAPAAPVPADSPPAAAPEGPQQPPAVDLGCHGSAPCQRLIALGAVAGGLGLAGIAAGAVLLLRPITVDPGDPTTLITYRPAGAAVLAVGTGLVATWLLTLLAARRAAKIAQRRHLGLRPAPRLALAPPDPPVP